MSIALNDETRRLLDGPHYAVLATINPDGKGADRIGQLYYALFARIRPTTPKEATDAQKLGGKEGGLWTEEDAKAVDMRYQVLKTRNIKHFSNPLVGDTALSTADKAKRTKVFAWQVPVQVGPAKGSPVTASPATSSPTPSRAAMPAPRGRASRSGGTRRSRGSTSGS